MIDFQEGSIFAVRKPPGISSFAVVKRIRASSGIQRIGHAGTLDPFAEGVLVVGMGRSATRQLGAITSSDKEYIGEVILGIATDTGDPTGKVIEERPLPDVNDRIITSVLNKFHGEIQQTPPKYSAIKVGGQRLYRLARKGIEVERTPRFITIGCINLISYTISSLRIRVVCSKGTYIRTLAEDIARELGTVGHLESLVRTRVGAYKIEDAVELSDIVDSFAGFRNKV